jgi:ABC-2 type transport system permease protein
MTAGSAVAAPAALGLSFRTLFRLMLTRGRLVAFGLLGLVAIIVGWAIGVSVDQVDQLDAGASVMTGMGLAVLIPVVTLVFASASLGDLRDDRTLVYLWLRPMDRWPLAVGAFAATVAVAAPLTLVPLGISTALTGGGVALVGASLLAGLVAVVAYSAVFVLLGLVLRRALVWGLAYVLIWEGFVAAAGAGAARVAIRAYTRSIVYGLTDASTDTTTMTVPVAIAVPVVVAAGALALASWWLGRMDID